MPSYTCQRFIYKTYFKMKPTALLKALYPIAWYAILRNCSWVVSFSVLSTQLATVCILPQEAFFLILGFLVWKALQCI